jgi:esterase/lipase
MGARQIVWQDDDTDRYGGRMEILKEAFRINDAFIPSVNILEKGNARSAVIIHGYGGNKEEMLGLSLAIAEAGINTYTIDLRGHGESVQPFSAAIADDVNQIIHSLKRTTKVMALGHSFGGRLSLLSDADYRIGISPALDHVYSEQTMSMINKLRRYRVNEVSENINFTILKELMSVDAGLKDTDLVLYGTRDVPEIKNACLKLKATFNNVVEIAGALHNDICTLNETFEAIAKFIEHKARL